MSLQERVRYLEVELVALKRGEEAELATLKRKEEAKLSTLKRKREAELVTSKRKGEAGLATLKRKGKASVACLEQFLYEGLCQVSTQSWTSCSLDLSIVLKDADEIGPVSYQVNIWLAAILGLPQASGGVRPR
jgi:hypothetical protein